jgi:hypothetical protein
MKILILLLGCVATAAAAPADSPDWTRLLTTNKGPGKFTPLPSLHLAYRFGWSGLTAAKADMHLTSKRNTYEIDAAGGTVGFPRSLFPLDVAHQAVADRSTLRPIHVYQEEKYRSETVRTTIDFTPREVTSLRQTFPAKDPPKPRTFDASPAYDLQSALLWIRSQPLGEGDQEMLVAYPSNAPYLATVRVLGREKIRIAGQDRAAIKVDLKLNAIDKNLKLKAHKRFKSARGWLSDDDLRIPLRIEADLFIGYVFAELESLEKD